MMWHRNATGLTGTQWVKIIRPRVGQSMFVLYNRQGCVWIFLIILITLVYNIRCQWKSILLFKDWGGQYLMHNLCSGRNGLQLFPHKAIYYLVILNLIFPFTKWCYAPLPFVGVLGRETRYVPEPYYQLEIAFLLLVKKMWLSMVSQVRLHPWAEKLGVRLPHLLFHSCSSISQHKSSSVPVFSNSSLSVKMLGELLCSLLVV